MVGSCPKNSGQSENSLPCLQFFVGQGQSRWKSTPILGPLLNACTVCFTDLPHKAMPHSPPSRTRVLHSRPWCMEECRRGRSLWMRWLVQGIAGIGCLSGGSRYTYHAQLILDPPPPRSSLASQRWAPALKVVMWSEADNLPCTVLSSSDFGSALQECERASALAEVIWAVQRWILHFASNRISRSKS